MRVLLVHNRYRTPGGEERHVDLLSRWLQDAAVDVRRFEVASPANPSVANRVRLGLTLTYRRAGASLLREALDREKPDIVHFHNLFPLLTPAAAREARNYGCRVVLTVHNYRFACPAGTLLRRGRIHDDCIEGSSFLCGVRNARGRWDESVAYGLALELQRRLRMLHRWVDAYVAPCDFVASMLARAGYPPERIHTIYHGTPIAETTSSGGGFGLYAGRLSDEKGIRTLIDSKRMVPEVPLVVAGEGPLASFVREAEGDGLAYEGPIAATALTELRRRALFTVVPSQWYEVQPFAVLESMAAGKAVVASRLGGLEEIVEDGENGILVRPGDPSALADAMSVLWRDRARTESMGERALAYARERFSPVAQTMQVIRLYEQLVGKSR